MNINYETWMLLSLILSIMIPAFLLKIFSVMMPMQWWMKMACIVGLSAWVTLVATQGHSLLGNARNISVEGLLSTPGTVLAYTAVGEVEIRLWMQTEDSETPTYFVIPYSKQAHQELQDAFDKAKEEGSNVKNNSDGDRQEGERMFYPEPVPSLPPKSY